MEKILVLEEKYASSLGALRNLPALKAAIVNHEIWLRGFTAGKDADKLTASLPVLRAYTADKDNLLFQAGKRTPTERLAELTWLPIREFIAVTMPVSAMPGTLSHTLDITLKRSDVVRENFALMVDLAEWKKYAETASETRLKQLSFAVSATADVLITGTPLPNMPGMAYWRTENILLPAGLDFDPPVVAKLVAQQKHGHDSFMVFEPGGSWQDVSAIAFQPAKRSAIRLTSI